MAHIKLKTKDIEKVFKKFKALQRNGRWSNFHFTCELTLIDGQLNISIPGAQFSLTGETFGTAKATFDFYRLYSIVEHYNHELITIEFLDEIVQVGFVQFKAQTTFFKSDNILRTIKLPFPYTDLDLISLKTEGYTEEEIEFNNLTDLIEQAERRIYYNIRRASQYLREYGVMPKEIKKLLMDKLGIVLDLDLRDVKLLLTRDKMSNEEP